MCLLLKNCYVCITVFTILFKINTKHLESNFIEISITMCYFLIVKHTYFEIIKTLQKVSISHFIDWETDTAAGTLN